jgi:hypothetical protein
MNNREAKDFHDQATALCLSLAAAGRPGVAALHATVCGAICAPACPDEEYGRLGGELARRQGRIIEDRMVTGYYDDGRPDLGTGEQPQRPGESSNVVAARHEEKALSNPARKLALEIHSPGKAVLVVGTGKAAKRHWMSAEELHALRDLLDRALYYNPQPRPAAEKGDPHQA